MCASAGLAVDGSAIIESRFVGRYRKVGPVETGTPAGPRARAPGGSIEPPGKAAPRELAEETGHRAARWRRLGTFWTAPGFASEAMTLYLATELTAIDGYDGPQPDERLDLVRLPWREALALAETGRIEDAKSLGGIFWLAPAPGAGATARRGAAPPPPRRPSRFSACPRPKWP